MKSEIFMVNGATKRQDGIDKIGDSTYIMFHGLFDGEDDTKYELRAVFDHKPELQEVRDLINGWYKAQKDNDKAKGFEWTDAGGNVILVPCTDTDVSNYKAIWDLAFQLNGANLPYRFKLGTSDKPQYKTFTTLEEMQPFVLAVMSFVGEIYNKWWPYEDSIDWSKYETINE